MSLHKREAPLSVVGFIWSVAALMAIFFAVVLSSFFIMKTYFPVDAQEAELKPVTGNCAQGETKIAIHNYPGDTAVTKAFPNLEYKHGPVVDAVGGNYQCSMICVSKIDQLKPVSDPANLKVIEEYLTGGTVGDQPIKLIRSNSAKTGGDQFVDMVKAAIADTNQSSKQQKLDELKRAVIIDYSKTLCSGYNQSTKGGSIDYAQIKVKSGEAVKKEQENKTKEEAELAKKQQEEAKKAQQAQTSNAGSVPGAVLPPPTTGAPAPVTQVSKKTSSDQDVRTKLNNCMFDALRSYAKVKEYYSTKVNISRFDDPPVMIKWEDISSYHKTVDALYKRRPTTQDPAGDLQKCKTILATLNEINKKIATASKPSSPIAKSEAPVSYKDDGVWSKKYSKNYFRRTSSPLTSGTIGTLASHLPVTIRGRHYIAHFIPNDDGLWLIKCRNNFYLTQEIGQNTWLIHSDKEVYSIVDKLKRQVLGARMLSGSHGEMQDVDFSKVKQPPHSPQGMPDCSEVRIPLP